MSIYHKHMRLTLQTDLIFNQAMQEIKKGQKIYELKQTNHRMHLSPYRLSWGNNSTILDIMKKN